MLPAWLDRLNTWLYSKSIATARYFKTKSAGTIAADFLSFLVVAFLFLYSPACLVITYVLFKHGMFY